MSQTNLKPTFFLLFCLILIFIASTTAVVAAAAVWRYENSIKKLKSR
jgi:hypothetical protein